MVDLSGNKHFLWVAADTWQNVLEGNRTCVSPWLVKRGTLRRGVAASSCLVSVSGELLVTVHAVWTAPHQTL